MSDIQKPAIDALVGRDAHRRVRGGRMVQYTKKGRVLAIVDDERAWGGWVALVRWNSPRPGRFVWEAIEAHHFDDGADLGVSVIGKPRSR